MHLPVLFSFIQGVVAFRCNDKSPPSLLHAPIKPSPHDSFMGDFPTHPYAQWQFLRPYSHESRTFVFTTFVLAYIAFNSPTRGDYDSQAFKPPRRRTSKPQLTTMILCSRFCILGLFWLICSAQTSYATVTLGPRAAASTSVVLDGVTYVNKVRAYCLTLHLKIFISSIPP